ncbi:MAG: efflux RND transporter periplasmic adaptor subunit [Patescibacteria group bacterium]|nr:efflux RND transporter periplasmic adaptor subunit [Patescibacteria group bacterium]
MIKIFKKINTNWNLFNSLLNKTKKLLGFLKKRKLLVIFLTIVTLISGYFLYQKFRPKSPEELYNLQKVTKSDIKQTVSASGSIQSQTQVDLKFQTSGQLAWVGVKEGDYVNQWQALASLDQKALKKTFEKYLFDYSKERNDFEEDKQETYKDIIVTDSIKRILQKNQWDLNKAVLDVELYDITVKYATLITPIKGIVTRIDNPIAGVNITPATAVFTVADPEFLEFVALIDEVDVGLLKATQSAQIILDTYPNEPIDTFISSIDFDSSTDSSGSTVYLVKFKLLNPDLSRYRLGMNGEVIITTAQKQNVTTIPYQSILEEDNKLSVQLIKDNTLINQTITIGISNDEDIEVISGLEPGQTIVVGKKH